MKYLEIKSLLNSISDPVEKLEVLMDIGKDLAPIPTGQTGTEIKGCASKVEIFKDNLGNFYAMADSALVSGIVKILLTMKQENIDFSEFYELNLNLGASRLNGTAGIIAYLKGL